MPLLHPVPYLGLVFKYSHLIAPALLNNIGDDFGALYHGFAQGDLIPVRDKVDFIQLDRTAINGESVYIDRLPWRDFVLLAPGFNNGVNDNPPTIIYCEILPTPLNAVKLNPS